MKALEGRQILVVEDEYLIADDLRDAVAELGGTVLGPCSDLDSARRVIAATPPDGAVLDLNLKGASVADLAHELDRMGVPLFYHTGYSTTVSAEGLPEGRFTTKPMSFKALAREIANTFAPGAKPR